MFDRTQQKLTKTSRLLVGFCIVVFGTWFVAAQFTSAAQKGRDAAKQIELKELEKALVLYDLSRNAFPRKLGNSEWCEIGKRYGDRVCLYELTRDGYFSALPISPDENPYYYKQTQRSAYLAVSINHDLKTLQQRTCEIEGKDMWCIHVDSI